MNGTGIATDERKNAVRAIKHFHGLIILVWSESEINISYTTITGINTRTGPSLT